MNFYGELSKISVENLFRLIVDGRLHFPEDGWKGYANREHGCLPAAFRAFAEALTNIHDTHLSVELIKKIHRLSTTNVAKMGVRIPGEFRTTHTLISLFGIDTRRGSINATERGFNQLYHAMSNYSELGACIAQCDRTLLAEKRTWKEFDDFLSQLQTEQSQADLWRDANDPTLINDDLMVSYRPPDPEHVPHLMQDIVDHYNEKITTAETEDEKLRIIVAHVQAIEQLHPFNDGNLRTAYILLQRLLIQNGFLPAMLYDPNFFDGFDVDTLVEMVKEGIENTRRIINDPKYKLFNFEAAITPSPNLDKACQFELYDIIQSLAEIEMRHHDEAHTASSSQSEFASSSSHQNIMQSIAECKSLHEMSMLLKNHIHKLNVEDFINDIHHTKNDDKIELKTLFSRYNTDVIFDAMKQLNAERQIDLLKLFIKASPQQLHAEAYFRMAESYRKSNHPIPALLNYAKTVSMDPTFQGRIKQRIKSVFDKMNFIDELKPIPIHDRYNLIKQLLDPTNPLGEVFGELCHTSNTHALHTSHDGARYREIRKELQTHLEEILSRGYGVSRQSP